MPVTIANYKFEGPYHSTVSLKNHVGVYAILTSTSKIRYRILDVGESGSIKDRVESHDRKSCWEKYTTQRDIRYAAHYTPGTSAEQRRKIEKVVRDKYEPPCGQS